MRRSKSSSNIPRPSLLFPTKIPAESRGRDHTTARATSTSRDNREEIECQATPLGQYLRGYPSGSGPKYQSIQKGGGPLFTPSFSSYRSRSRSVSSAASRFSSASRAKSPIPNKDKKWVAEKYFKIQSFIETSGHFNPELAGKIKPPTMAIFVELMSVLLGQLIKVGPIDVKNVGEIVMEKLRVLKYPGQLTASNLKSINTTHGWPHFVSITSWLIERIELGTTEVFTEQQSEETQQTMSMFNALFNYLHARFRLLSPNQTPSQDQYSEINQCLESDLLQLTNTDLNEAKKAEELLEQESAKLEKLTNELEQIEAENEAISTQNKERRNIIDQFKLTGRNKEEQIKEELAQIKKTFGQQNEVKEDIKKSIARLEDCISKQLYKLQDKNDMLRKIEDIKETIKRKEHQITEFRAVQDDLEIEFKNLRRKIESQVDNWNISIRKTFLPELQNMQLREKDFTNPDFLKELIEIRKEKMAIQEKLLEEYNQALLDIERIDDQKKSLSKQKMMRADSIQKIDNLKAQIKRLKEEIANMNDDLLKAQKDHKERMAEITNSGEQELSEIRNSIKCLEAEYVQWNEKIQETSKTGLAVIISARNDGIENLQELERASLEKLNEIVAALQGSNQNLEESFEHLLKLKQTNAILRDALNQK